MSSSISSSLAQGCQMAKFDPFLSSDCARVEGVGAQSKERKGSNFVAQRSGAAVQKPKGPNTYNSKNPAIAIWQPCLGVAGVVLPECAHQDHGDEADEEDDHHERVEDGEPVDAVLEKVGVQVLVEPAQVSLVMFGGVWDRTPEVVDSHLSRRKSTLLPNLPYKQKQHYLLPHLSCLFRDTSTL